MTTKAEILVMHLQVKEHQSMLANHQNLVREKERFPFRLQKEHSPVGHLDFGFIAFVTVGQYIFDVFSQQVCSTLWYIFPQL